MNSTPDPVGVPDADELSEEIRTLVRNLSARLRMEAAHVTDLPVPQQSVLMRLSMAPGSTSAELARLEFVRPQSMNTTVAALRDQGLVQAGSSDDDGRRKVLTLTDAGQDELRRIRSSRSDWLSRQLRESLTASDRATLARALELLRGIATAPGEPPTAAEEPRTGEGPAGDAGPE